MAFDPSGFFSVVFVSKSKKYLSASLCSLGSSSSSSGISFLAVFTNDALFDTVTQLGDSQGNLGTVWNGWETTDFGTTNGPKLGLFRDISEPKLGQHLEQKMEQQKNSSQKL